MSRSSVALLACLLSVSALGIMAACGGDGATEPDPCMPIINGLVAYNPGIELLVRDASGQGQAIGDTAVAYRGTDSVITTGYDTLRVLAGFGAPGTYAVRLKRKFYRQTVIPGIEVKTGICGGPVLTTVPVTLQVEPGAPALRSITLFGAYFLYAPGVQEQVVARFDADPTVPRTVAWRLSDTSVARIDANGLITARCTTKSNVKDTVTALATVDTMARATAVFSVAPQASCP
ncbi:MAG: Ig-like domain-containing protein [Gemmatimonadaceae bacterium]